jgi:hypothetical protein
MTYAQQIESRAQNLAEMNGRDWSDMGVYERDSYRDEARKPLSKELESELFAATAHAVFELWGDKMGDMQVMTLTNQIVREIERRGILSGQ